MAITPVEIYHINAPLPAGDNSGRQNSTPATGKFEFPEKSQKTRNEYAGVETNPALQMLQISLSFSIDEASKRVVIKVVDATTHELIRQIPPDETLKIAAEIVKAMDVHFDQTV
jgi:uncharacterized FlaG/YvyC family protein